MGRPNSPPPGLLKKNDTTPPKNCTFHVRANPWHEQAMRVRAGMLPAMPARPAGRAEPAKVLAATAKGETPGPSDASESS